MATTDKETDKETDKKAMDVAKPGKTLPDTSARPVIVTHRPMVRDPMMVNSAAKSDDSTDETKSSGESAKISAGSGGSKVIQPVSATLKADEQSTDKSSDQPSSDSDQLAEAAVVQAVADQARSSRRDGEPTEEEKAQQKHLQKLITGKTYFVPVGQLQRKRNQRAVVIVAVILLLAVIGVYAAVDAGIIRTNVKLPVDLIKN